MSFFVQPTMAPTPKTETVRGVSLIFAGIVISMLVAQLFTFEKFPDVITALALPGGQVFSKVWAALTVIFEAGALPFLFSMSLSPAARVLSMIAAWIVAGGWFTLAVWELVSGHGMINSGLLGGSLAVMGGWWMVFFGSGLIVLAIWVSWGMWPRKTK